MQGEQAWHAAPLSEFRAHEVAGRFGRDHEDVHVFGRNDLAEMNREAVSEGEILAGTKMRSNFVAVDPGRSLVWDKHHDDVGPGRGIGRALDVQAGFFSFGP